MYKCDICNYETLVRTALYAHRKTAKHIKNKLTFNNNEEKIKELDEKMKKIELENERIKNLELENERIKKLELENEQLKHNLIDSKNENSTLLKYIDLLLQNKNNSKIRKYKKKCRIPATIRNLLWQKYFNKSTEGKCCCCKFEPISRGNFDCGHIISEHNGGLVTLDNLKPICRLCNSSMSTMNMDEFIKNYKVECIPVNK